MNICVYSKVKNLVHELRRVLPNQKFLEITSGTDQNLQSSQIVVADFDLLAPHIYNLPNLKWVQGTWAGVDKLIPHVDKPLPFPVTRFSGHHFGQMISEFVIASIVNFERDMYTIYENQKDRNWSRTGRIFDYRSISDLTVAILGVGNIGTWIAKSLNLLGSTVLGYGRSLELSDTENKKFIARYYNKEKLEDLLDQSDYIINILPHTQETKGLLNNDVLKVCASKKPVLINVGRGSLIDEKDLIRALNQKWLSAAILDVFNTEPLPPDNALWTTPNVFITPHTAAVSMAKHIAEQFSQNFNLYLNNKPLLNNISFEKCY